MDKNAIRIKYFNEMNKVKDHAALPDDETDNYFDTLLSFLPNDGVLYKYKSLSSFDYVFDSLIKGYIYMPACSELNDRIETFFL